MTLKFYNVVTILLVNQLNIEFKTLNFISKHRKLKIKHVCFKQNFGYSDNMKDVNKIKEIECTFPDVIQKQINTLNELFEMIQYQRHLLESGNFEMLFSTKGTKDYIVEVIKDQGDNIVELQQKWSEHKEDLPTSIHKHLNTLVNKLSKMTEKVLNGENKNYNLIEHPNNLIDQLENNPPNENFINNDDSDYF